MIGAKKGAVSSLYLGETQTVCDCMYPGQMYFSQMGGLFLHVFWLVSVLAVFGNPQLSMTFSDEVYFRERSNLLPCRVSSNNPPSSVTGLLRQAKICPRGVAGHLERRARCPPQGSGGCMRAKNSGTDDVKAPNRMCKGHTGADPPGAPGAAGAWRFVPRRSQSCTSVIGLLD